jgi:hypothetical protein|tara:strand:+ start:2179 stop:2913 length:735 start_codon:yes stop_codon:yes gene_type:complete
MINKLITYDADAAFLFRSENTGTLSTISKQYNGYPFGSFVTYLSGNSRAIFLYVSDIAEHTKNFLHNSKASLTITKLDTTSDQQNSERLTLMGNITKLTNQTAQQCEARFFKFFPESRKYESMHDFNFYRFDITEARWIGGFGQIAWLDSTKWKTNEPAWAKDEANIIDHMNDDHTNVIYSTLHGEYGVRDKNSRMIAITIDGYYIKSKQRLYFIRFDKPCQTAKEIRDTLISHAHSYRKYEIA